MVVIREKLDSNKEFISNYLDKRSDELLDSISLKHADLKNHGDEMMVLSSTLKPADPSTEIKKLSLFKESESFISNAKKYINQIVSETLKEKMVEVIQSSLTDSTLLNANIKNISKIQSPSKSASNKPSSSKNLAKPSNSSKHPSTPRSSNRTVKPVEKKAVTKPVTKKSSGTVDATIKTFKKLNIANKHVSFQKNSRSKTNTAQDVNRKTCTITRKLEPAPRKIITKINRKSKKSTLRSSNQGIKTKTTKKIVSKTKNQGKAKQNALTELQMQRKKMDWNKVFKV